MERVPSTGADCRFVDQGGKRERRETQGYVPAAFIGPDAGASGGTAVRPGLAASLSSAWL
jgi:hypothetical protein